MDGPFEDTDEFIEEICVLREDGRFVIAEEEMLLARSKQLMEMEVGHEFTVAIYRLKAVRTFKKSQSTPVQ